MTRDQLLEYLEHFTLVTDGNRLAEHGSFSFDAANTPTHNAKAVDHGGV